MYIGGCYYKTYLHVHMVLCSLWLYYYTVVVYETTNESVDAITTNVGIHNSIITLMYYNL